MGIKAQRASIKAKVERTRIFRASKKDSQKEERNVFSPIVNEQG